jgi:hypothetical protein
MINVASQNSVGRLILPEPQTAPAVCPVCTGLECLCRPRFFSGQLLTEADLTTEQDYVVKKNRLHNLYLHGWGVVCGMEVVCHPNCSGWVRITDGYGISPCGDDVVVCNPVDFNFIQAVNDCIRQMTKQQLIDCTPRTGGTSDCDADGCWYLTVRYQETATRAMAALKAPAQVQVCTCSTNRCTGCGPGSNGCGCGCKSCAGAAAVKANGASNGKTSSFGLPCEPTRVCEGYVVEVCRAPQEKEPTPRDLLGDTLLGQIYQCLLDVKSLANQAPTDPSTSSTSVNTAALFASCCKYVAMVKQFFQSHGTTKCQALDTLSGMQCPQPTPGEAAGDYWNQIQPMVDQIDQMVAAYLMDCICSQLLPPCPTDPCDLRLILASVCVSQGEITEICNWKGRKIVPTWPTILWWLSILPIQRMLSILIQKLCCGEYGYALPTLMMQSQAGALDAGYSTESANPLAMMSQLLGAIGPVIKAVEEAGKV